MAPAVAGHQIYTLKAIYRGTIEEYTQKYNNTTLQQFDKMQHEMQHKK